MTRIGRCHLTHPDLKYVPRSVGVTLSLVYMDCPAPVNTEHLPSLVLMSSLIRSSKFSGADANLPASVISFLALLALGALWRRHKSIATRLPLPPSPPKHWLWQNRELMNQPYRYVPLATEYRETLGDIICLQTANETNIVVNTIELANELLEKQAAATANRPRNVMAQEILGWSTSVGLYRTHDECHKKMRRVIASVLHQTAARSYAPQHLEYTLEFLRRVYAKPENVANITKDVTGAFIMRLAYGHMVVENDPLLKIVHESNAFLAQTLNSYYLVNDFPILKYLPAWFPGASFQQVGKQGRKLREEYLSAPFEAVFSQVSRGHIERRSYTSQLLEEKGGMNTSQEDLYLIRCTAGTMFTDLGERSVMSLDDGSPSRACENRPSRN
ncbi:Cytochrome P450 family oxidoreductase [Ceratobasidium theobromae]|uniref:Cytochrome P450 family oxidoreductase n=1 Tax=Ceratobasidium theobromae TaxID=1582974 RepID=A0A5N5QD03_9AGAM|nr:Cytochrome P450 family oxidoreductase [Ceratobasidium theobromae]